MQNPIHTHAPHPWSSLKIVGYNSHEISNRHGVVIAYVISTGTPGDDVTAGLIKSAPDLADALRECVTDENSDAHVSLPNAMKRLSTINKIVNEALAKIDGGDLRGVRGFGARGTL